MFLTAPGNTRGPQPAPASPSSIRWSAEQVPPIATSVPRGVAAPRAWAQRAVQFHSASCDHRCRPLISRSPGGMTIPGLSRCPGPSGEHLQLDVSGLLSDVVVYDVSSLELT
ncbi:hypothetical protein NDU88_008494 [Pleurodeles waltl]|uniref:Uncharacterized protein n=1 Tax=Pleurodeles waltl TaxID=8319 RepID=A0AAV7RXU3_PLEWA|nr:hypothetical protein NDU88_008494 [Pleurodeles waltl]